VVTCTLKSRGLQRHLDKDLVRAVNMGSREAHTHQTLSLWITCTTTGRKREGAAVMMSLAAAVVVMGVTREMWKKCC
jgi:acyl dehydratase